MITTDFGYDITWAKTDNYVCKILAFEHPSVKTPMMFNEKTEKSIFINNGRFRLRFIDTKDGKVYENEMDEGGVFHIPALMPCSIESLTAGGSITQVSSQDPRQDQHLVIPSGNLSGKEDA